MQIEGWLLFGFLQSRDVQSRTIDRKYGSHRIPIERQSVFIKCVQVNLLLLILSIDSH